MDGHDASVAVYFLFYKLFSVGMAKVHDRC